LNRKLEKEKELKDLDNRIRQVRSEIDKHKEALSELRENQKFLLRLTPDEVTQARERLIATRK
jgi:predicted  nucleic acid-binding Zn-ribbon protein